MHSVTLALLAALKSFFHPKKLALVLWPLLNFIAPVYVALAFIHLCLDELQQLRLHAAGRTGI